MRCSRPSRRAAQEIQTSLFGAVDEELTLLEDGFVFDTKAARDRIDLGCNLSVNRLDLAAQLHHCRIIRQEDLELALIFILELAAARLQRLNDRAPEKVRAALRIDLVHRAHLRFGLKEVPLRLTELLAQCAVFGLRMLEQIVHMHQILLRA